MANTDPSKNARQRADDMAAATATPDTNGNFNPRNTVTAASGSSSNNAGLRRTLTSLSFYEDARSHAEADETTAVLSPLFGGSLRNYRTTTGSAPPQHSSTLPIPRRGSPGATRTSYPQSLPSLRVRRKPRDDDDGGDDGDEDEPDEDGQQQQQQSGQTDGEKKATWWTRVISPLQSIELENHGSVARDHLALERTFLAWLRTSLAFASIGIAVTQLFRLNTSVSDPVMQNTLRKFGRPLGATFLAISIVILLLGYRRFRLSQRWIIQGKFPASRGTVIALVLITLAIMLVSLIVVVAIHPGGV
ncbi:protein of unknown function (DUF202) [Geosmithia morbida]|uniref:DUF202 domain-containing protein n=1 Tax=Geosmithia morbida TaxID=1094350 RepID=A0A9P4YVY0_9HYPO|nr:protein of unknown function (DUF202) [Geosmithia morbida]KAF4123522.1 protein of unknown function (DUF202) [Geosmithia morbida]